MRHLLLLFFTILTVSIFSFLKVDTILLPGFLGNVAILFLMLIHHLYLERKFSPFISAYLVFSFLFFIVAPMMQLSFIQKTTIPVFVTNLPYDKSLVIKTNMLILFFNISFFVTYIFLKKFFFKSEIKELSKNSQRIIPLTILTVLGLSIIVFFASIPFVQYELVRPSWQASNLSVSSILIWKKVLFLVPFAGVILCFQYLRKKNKKPVNLVTVLLVLFCFLILLFWFKNPFIEKRNALGPIYICLIVIALPRLLNSNYKMLSFLFLIMIVVFPLTAVLTHTEATFAELLKDPSILFTETNKGGGLISTFNTLNYDAFVNISATIEYVQIHGMSLGYQSLSAFLFFIPRSFWLSKPISTGELIGNHLIEQHNFTFNNLSNPLVSEGYINFGILGVMFMAVFLAVCTVKFMQWINSPDYLKKILAYYLAIHFIFLLRGDFTNGFSYFIGTLTGVLLIPKLVEFLTAQLFLYQQNVKNSESSK